MSKKEKLVRMPSIRSIKSRGKAFGGAVSNVGSGNFKKVDKQQIFAVFMAILLVAGIWMTYPYMSDWLDEKNVEADAEAIREAHTADEPITVLPVTAGVKFKIPVMQFTEPWFEEHGWGRDEMGLDVKLYDNDPDTGAKGEKTALYQMITNRSYTVDVIESITNPSLTALTSANIKERTKGKIWCNNELQSQPFTDKYADQANFYVNVSADYMTATGSIGGTQRFGLGLPAYWTTDWSPKHIETMINRYTYDDVWIYLPLDPDVRYDHILITVTGTIKKIEETAGYAGDWERGKPDSIGPEIDYYLENDLGNQIQPIIYEYPLEYDSMHA